VSFNCFLSEFFSLIHFQTCFFVWGGLRGHQPLGRLDTSHGVRKPLLVLLAPQQDWTKQNRRCSITSPGPLFSWWSQQDSTHQSFVRHSGHLAETPRLRFLYLEEKWLDLQGFTILTTAHFVARLHKYSISAHMRYNYVSLGFGILCPINAKHRYICFCLFPNSASAYSNEKRLEHLDRIISFVLFRTMSINHFWKACSKNRDLRTLLRTTAHSGQRTEDPTPAPFTNKLRTRNNRQSIFTVNRMWAYVIEITIPSTSQQRLLDSVY